MSTRKLLSDLYLDYVNNFGTVQGFASYHGLAEDEAKELINLGRSCNNNPHPEA